MARPRYLFENIFYCIIDYYDTYLLGTYLRRYSLDFIYLPANLSFLILFFKVSFTYAYTYKYTIYGERLIASTGVLSAPSSLEDSPMLLCLNPPPPNYTSSSHQNSLVSVSNFFFPQLETEDANLTGNEHPSF